MCADGRGEDGRDPQSRGWKTFVCSTRISGHYTWLALLFDGLKRVRSPVSCSYPPLGKIDKRFRFLTFASPRVNALRDSLGRLVFSWYPLELIPSTFAQVGW